MDVINKITRKVIQVIILLITFMLIYSLAEFIFFVGRAAILQHAAFSFSVEPIDRNKVFLGQVQGLISAALLLTILIELIYSLIQYLKLGSKNYVIVITEIAFIAIVRHLLSVDFEHVNANVLFGLSALLFVLGFFYLVATKNILINLERTKKNGDTDEK